MTPERIQGEFILDESNIQNLIEALESANTWKDLREDETISAFATIDKTGGQTYELTSLEAYYNLVHSHLGLKNGELPPNTITLSERFLALQSQILSGNPNNMVSMRIVQSLNEKLAPQISAHEFLPSEQRISTFWKIALRGEENEAGK